MPLEGTPQSSHRAELMGIIPAVEAAPEGQFVVIHSDCRGAIDTVRSWQDLWKRGLKRRFTRMKTGLYLSFQEDLFQRMRMVMKSRQIKAALVYVKGYSGVRGNERAHKLAGIGARIPDRVLEGACSAVP